ncbi:TetR/AcrR family transcriptional regulator [Tenacibaculum finnmarkense]|uniref:TetR/AcrR family transcriptional regulator n=1 Tax=Tenacibaculum finnmarkense TaxID=2781243 RepID=UPI001EFC1A9A|nr:TetR/AcrR family transcriptional regulator [Tenacibaculum finnmarkense]MCG8208452.1 helix-turn-helix transcriptional regulator [Tenacibaculum finnmarkense genomovar finnmarkense]MCG8724405.1 helix-turn-helix transcriptional regulator [Tenacibaculum finnmarkense]MCG8742724.1 helix-turn-helix transcriptional regulator [Tenacibaculum finnmarkense]MCG8766134.1 helix-turn-helix transcriptional regulator [Tenacibaculum finnmarkense]MCG8779087.1 helix-turn-helix transcriptional regulator [Tenaciba
MNKLKPKERVMEVSSKLFREQGFNSTGVNQIIKEANVAKASFYDHFKSKDLLAIEYLNNRHILWFKGLKKHINEYKTSKEKILKSFEYLKLMNKKENFGGCVFLNMMSELKHENKESYEIIKNHKIDLQNFFNEITKDEDKSFVIYMLFESCLMESQVFRSQETINRTIKYLNSKIL